MLQESDGRLGGLLQADHRRRQPPMDRWPALIWVSPVFARKPAEYPAPDAAAGPRLMPRPLDRWRSMFSSSQRRTAAPRSTRATSVPGPVSFMTIFMRSRTRVAAPRPNDMMNSRRVLNFSIGVPIDWTTDACVSVFHHSARAEVACSWSDTRSIRACCTSDSYPTMVYACPRVFFLALTP